MNASKTENVLDDKNLVRIILATNMETFFKFQLIGVKIMHKIAFLVAVLGTFIIALTSSVAAQTPQPDTKICAPVANVEKFHCTNGKVRMFGPFVSNFTKESDCIKFCSRSPGGRKDDVIVDPNTNTDWVGNIAKNKYKPGDVYTDLYVNFQPEKEFINNTKNCQSFGIGAAFFTGLAGTKKNTTYKIVAVLSDKNLSSLDSRTLSNANGLVLPLIEITRDIEKNSCTAKFDSISGKFFMARLRADKTPLHVTILVLSDTDNALLQGLRSTTDGSGFSKLSAFLNGNLSNYGDKLGFLADHLAVKRSNNIITRTQIPLFPDEAFKDQELLDFRVVFGGKDVAKFSIFQSSSISEIGSLENTKSFRIVRGRKLLIDLNNGYEKTISEALVNTSAKFILDEATFSDQSTLERACSDLEIELGKFDLSNRALDHIKATMLKDFTNKATLRQSVNDGYKTCLTQDERKRYPFLCDITLGCQLPLGPTCQSIVPGNGKDVATRVTNAAIKALRTQYSNLNVEEGEEFFRISEGVNNTPTLASYFGQISQLGSCQRWNNKDDDTEGTRANQHCQYIFRVKTTGRNPQPLYVLMQAKPNPIEGHDPIADFFIAGVDPRHYVNNDGLGSCLTTVQEDFSANLVATNSAN